MNAGIRFGSTCSVVLGLIAANLLWIARVDRNCLVAGHGSPRNLYRSAKYEHWFLAPRASFATLTHLLLHRASPALSRQTQASGMSPMCGHVMTILCSRQLAEAQMSHQKFVHACWSDLAGRRQTDSHGMRQTQLAAKAAHVAEDI
eukprot:6478924-Amphidinium_carterae.2